MSALRRRAGRQHARIVGTRPDNLRRRERVDEVPLRLFDRLHDRRTGVAGQSRRARVNERRKGRIVVARGRDAADIPVISNFGVVTIDSFEVRADELGRCDELLSSARRAARGR